MGVCASMRGALSTCGEKVSLRGMDLSTWDDMARGAGTRDASVSNERGRELRVVGNVGALDRCEVGFAFVPESLCSPLKVVDDAPGAVRTKPRTGVFSGADWKRVGPPGTGVPEPHRQCIPFDNYFRLCPPDWANDRAYHAGPVALDPARVEIPGAVTVPGLEIVEAG